MNFEPKYPDSFFVRPCCGLALHAQSRIEPARFFVIRHIRPQQARKALREQAAIPEPLRLHERLPEIRQQAAPGYGLAKACHYILRRWPSFSCYAQTGELPIDNSPVENAIRPIAHLNAQIDALLPT